MKNPLQRYEAQIEIRAIDITNEIVKRHIENKKLSWLIDSGAVREVVTEALRNLYAQIAILERKAAGK